MLGEEQPELPLLDFSSASSLNLGAKTHEMSDINEASEAGGPVCVSGGSPAACVANERGDASGARVPGVPSYGRWDLRPLRKPRVLQIEASLEAAIGCPACSGSDVNVVFLGGKQLDAHIQKHHPTTRVEWKCELCPKTFPKLHAWRCHFAKCKGVTIIPPTPFLCDQCTAGFESKSGLSQHERHAHPNIRNEKRAADYNPSAKGGKKLTIWTPAELELMKKLDFEYRNERNINIKLMEFFPGKTNKQIGEARRRFQSRTNTQAEVIQTVTTPEGEQSALHECEVQSETQSALSELEVRADANIDKSSWRDNLREEILTTYNAGEWTNFIDGFVNAVSLNEMSTASLDRIYDELIQSIINTYEKDTSKDVQGSNAHTSKRVKRRNRARPPNRVQRKKYAYARCQELMEKCPKKLADAVVAGDLSLLQIRDAPSLLQTRDLYRDLWGIAGPQQRKYADSDGCTPIENIFTPITPKEIEVKLTKIPNSSAAGPDGIRKADLRKKGVSVVLSKLFNCLLMYCQYPSAWRVNRTTLIPKPDKDVSDVKNWRPITISSIISRIFSSLLDRRLRRVISQTDRQKGFTIENGCYSSVQLLNQAITKAKEVGGTITVLDISKAFDTVPHTAIKVSLERKGIPSLVADYIMHTYEKCTTNIKTCDGNLTIELKRGVKQGDPLSPLLFNLSIEPIIDCIQDNTAGIEVESHNLAAMAFADDVVLLAKNKEVAAMQIQQVYDRLKEKDMTLSIDKCSTFEYVSRNKTWFIRNPDIGLGNQSVPYNDPDTAFRYLGAKISPWRGLIDGYEVNTIRDVLNRIQLLPIKPMQKIALMRSYILPKYTYGLIARPPSRGILKEIDTTIRDSARKMLHLHHTTSNFFFYTPQRQGGLGLLEIEKLVLIAALRNGIKALRSSDPVTRDCLLTEKCQKKYMEYAAGLRLEWPLTLERLDAYKINLKRSYVKEWAKQPVQGQGVCEFADEPIGNAWLSRSDLLRSSRLIDAIKMRTNTLPTRATLKRAYEDMDPICRACKEDQETLGHILGKCRTTKSKRIHRHNEIVNLLKNRLAHNGTIMVEPEIKVGSERYKPDLVVSLNEGGVLVLDVTVRYENQDFLAVAAAEKIDKYKCILPRVKAIFKAKTAKIVPIVIGSRGAIPRKTALALSELKIKKHDWLTMSLIALRSSIEIINAFMDA